MSPSRVYELELAEAPPSFNKVGFTGSRKTLSRNTKKWKDNIYWLLRAEPVLPCVFLEAFISIRFSTRRNRDEENYRVVISKALGDALQIEPAVISDDSRRDWRILGLQLEDDPGQPRTRIMLRCYDHYPRGAEPITYPPR